MASWYALLANFRRDPITKSPKPPRVARLEILYNDTLAANTAAGIIPAVHKVMTSAPASNVTTPAILFQSLDLPLYLSALLNNAEI